MHGFKRYNSSANPSDQVFIKDNEQGAAEPEEQLLFTESMIMDYVTLKGIENRFSIKKEEIPVSIFKELLDNALDHVETPAVNNSRSEFIPEIDVKISSNTDRINLEVSNPVITSGFTLKRIHSIFDFYNFSSTKRNQYKISRGALGNSEGYPWYVLRISC